MTWPTTRTKGTKTLETLVWIFLISICLSEFSGASSRHSKNRKDRKHHKNRVRVKDEDPDSIFNLNSHSHSDEIVTGGGFAADHHSDEDIIYPKIEILQTPKPEPKPKLKSHRASHRNRNRNRNRDRDHRRRPEPDTNPISSESESSSQFSNEQDSHERKSKHHSNKTERVKNKSKSKQKSNSNLKIKENNSHKFTRPEPISKMKLPGLQIKSKLHSPNSASVVIKSKSADNEEATPSLQSKVKISVKTKNNDDVKNPNEGEEHRVMAQSSENAPNTNDGKFTRKQEFHYPVPLPELPVAQSSHEDNSEAHQDEGHNSFNQNRPNGHFQETPESHPGQTQDESEGHAVTLSGFLDPSSPLATSLAKISSRILFEPLMVAMDEYLGRTENKQKKEDGGLKQSGNQHKRSGMIIEVLLKNLYQLSSKTETEQNPGFKCGSTNAAIMDSAPLVSPPNNSSAPPVPTPAPAMVPVPVEVAEAAQLVIRAIADNQSQVAELASIYWKTTGSLKEYNDFMIFTEFLDFLKEHLFRQHKDKVSMGVVVVSVDKVIHFTTLNCGR